MEVATVSSAALSTDGLIAQAAWLLRFGTFSFSDSGRGSQWSVRSVAVEFGCMAFACFFAVSALAKLDAWEFWISVVEGWLPKPVRPAPMAAIIPAFELVTSALLVASPTAGLMAAAALLATFAVGVALIANSRSGVACGCLGQITSGSIGLPLILRNALLAVVAGALAIVARKLEPEVVGSLGPAGATIVALAAVLVLLAAAAWKTLVHPPKDIREDST